MKTPFRQRILSVAAFTAAALGSFALASPAEAQSSNTSSSNSGWQANDDDFLYLQMQIKNHRLALDVRGYQTDRGVCLDLADVIQTLDLPVRIDKKSRRATGWLFAEDQEITIDREANTVQNMNTGEIPLAKDIYDTPEGWCVDTDALSRWFGVTFKPDLYNAAVRIESNTDLPFMQAIERRKRAERIRPRNVNFDLSQYPSSKMEYRSWRTPSVDVVVDAEARSNSGVGGRVEFLAAGEALGASYTARIGTDRNFNPQTLRLRAYRSNEEGGLLGPLDATDVAVGDVETVPGRLVGQTGVGRGAFITNRPLGQTSRFATTVLRGTLPSGWDAELYRNGQLIAFQQSRPDGRYEFLDVDLFFGRNEFEVVLYGPQGQVRRERSSLPVGMNQIEPGETQYWAGILQENRDLIQLQSNEGQEDQNWRWGAGVERGLSQRTSIGFGVHNLVRNDNRYTYTEAALTHALSFAQVELAAAHEFGGGVVTNLNTLGRIGDVNFGTNARVFFGNFRGEFGENEFKYTGGVNFATALRMGRLSLPIQAAFNRAKRRNGETVDALNLVTSVTAGRLALSAQLFHERDSGRPANDRTDLNLLVNRRWRNLRLRGNANFRLAGEDKGLDTATVRLETDLSDEGTLQGDIEYMANIDEFRLGAGYTHRFKEFSLRGDAFVTSSGAVGVGVQAAFSLGPDPASGGIRVSGAKLARNGQAAVTVFRDDNANNRRDPGEELLKNVMVEAGLRTTDAVTGENGTAIVDELRPFRPVLVGIDESSLEDPFLAPASKGIVITPRPGVVAQIELAISPTGEVEGSLLSPTGVEQSGVRLELIDKRGTVAAETVSEFDGFFLFQRVPYGEYRLRVSEDAANALDIEPQLSLRDGNARFTIGNENDVIRFGTVKLRPRKVNEKNRLQDVEVIASAGPP
ncbi:carboxypeptidase regulatory-like domain-containing protein [Erythrobacter sp. SCSIO 43205]|uniref:MSCRAMM family protein n=1 Tax=Erythrobacter sp. SCSIO 43205 TaxID=2779361 RepID=UPI001CA7E8CE|nr:carboxypeptidase-like regulatory domain-containing protein [Erythrobacter sp. SCSIO 43205]UAB78481.1 carboxypeptidase regulatory-like domain-containing protein [Erythrobacter sp. SCSIO 43205]